MTTQISGEKHIWFDKYICLQHLPNSVVVTENKDLFSKMSGSLTHWWSGTKQAFKLIGQFCMFFVPCSCSCPCKQDDEEQQRLTAKAKRKRKRWCTIYYLINKYNRLLILPSPPRRLMKKNMKISVELFCFHVLLFYLEVVYIKKPIR